MQRNQTTDVEACDVGFKRSWFVHEPHRAQHQCSCFVVILESSCLASGSHRIQPARTALMQGSAQKATQTSVPNAQAHHAQSKLCRTAFKNLQGASAAFVLGDPLKGRLEANEICVARFLVQLHNKLSKLRAEHVPSVFLLTWD